MAKVRRSRDARAVPVGNLPDAVERFGTPAFADALRRGLLSLPSGVLPIASVHGGAIDYTGIGVTLLATRADVECIEVRLGVFFTEVVGGCSCGDEPFQVAGFSELSVRIDRVDGATYLASPES